MADYTLEVFVEDCREQISASQFPAKWVEKTAACVYRPLNGDRSFLEPKHSQSDPEHNSRNAVHADDERAMSLHALALLPG